MYLPETEKFRTLYVDPGETAGWTLACGSTLLAAGQEALWSFADAFWEGTKREPTGILSRGGCDAFLLCAEEHEHLMDLPIKRIVFENFRLYKSHASAMVGDEFRTVRLIGALLGYARVRGGFECYDQPASIKTQAEVGGAAAFFLRPLHENRHANDSLRHWWYFAQFGPDGDPRVPNRKGQALNA